MKAWDWITSGGAKKYGVQASKFALGGTSAGGGLAASVAVRLRDAAHAFQPEAVALNIPWLARAPLDGKPLPGDVSWTDVKFDKIWYARLLNASRTRLTWSAGPSRTLNTRQKCFFPLAQKILKYTLSSTTTRRSTTFRR